MKRALRSNSLPRSIENQRGRQPKATTAQASLNKWRKMKFNETNFRSSAPSVQPFAIPLDVVRNGGQLKRTAVMQNSQATTSASKPAERSRGAIGGHACVGRGRPTMPLSPKKEQLRPATGAIIRASVASRFCKTVRGTGRGQIARVAPTIIARPRGLLPSIGSAPPVKRAKTIAERTLSIPPVPPNPMLNTPRMFLLGRKNQLVSQSAHGEPEINQMIGQLFDCSLEKPGVKKEELTADDYEVAADLNRLADNFTHCTLGGPAKKRRTGVASIHRMGEPVVNQMLGQNSNSLIEKPEANQMNRAPENHEVATEVNIWADHFTHCTLEGLAVKQETGEANPIGEQVMHQMLGKFSAFSSGDPATMNQNNGDNLAEKIARIVIGEKD